MAVKKNRSVKLVLLKSLSVPPQRRNLGQDWIGCEEFLTYENKEGLMESEIAVRT